MDSPTRYGSLPLRYPHQVTADAILYHFRRPPPSGLGPLPRSSPDSTSLCLATHSKHEFEPNHAGQNNPAENTPAGAKKSNESEKLSQFRLHRGRGKESPVYDDYRAIASFWEIAEGERADIEDPPEDLYSRVVLGRPRLTL